MLIKISKIPRGSNNLKSVNANITISKHVGMLEHSKDMQQGPKNTQDSSIFSMSFELPIYKILKCVTFEIQLLMIASLGGWANTTNFAKCILLGLV